MWFFLLGVAGLIAALYVWGSRPYCQCSKDASKKETRLLRVIQPDGTVRVTKLDVQILRDVIFDPYRMDYVCNICRTRVSEWSTIDR
jgi:hypothetical protein